MFHRLSDKERVIVPRNLTNSLNIEYFRCINNWVADKVKLGFSPRMRLAIKRTLRDFDIVHLNDLRNIPNYYTWKYAREYGTPYILQPRGSIAYHHYESLFRRTSKQVFDRAITKRLVEDASMLVALTNAEKEQLIDFGIKPNKIETIPNGFNMADYDDLPEKGEFREGYGIGFDEKVVLYLGRLHKRKGIDKLITAFADVKEELKDTKLVIAGPDDGSLLALEKQVHDYGLSEDTLFTGPLKNKAKSRAYVDADVSVLPATNEAFGRTMIESILCGTPVIASAEGGCGELLQDMGCGRIAAFSDPQMLSKNIKYLLRDPSKSQKLVEIGQRYVSENLTWSTVADKFEKLYGGCI